MRPQPQVGSAQVMFVRERKEGRETKSELKGSLFWKLMVAGRGMELVIFLSVTLISLIKNRISDFGAHKKCGGDGVGMEREEEKTGYRVKEGIY